MAGPSFTAMGNALSDTIGGMFDIPENNLDGQLVEMVSGDTSYQEPLEPEPVKNTSSGSNATSHDDGLDAALIDLLPLP